MKRFVALFVIPLIFSAGLFADGLVMNRISPEFFGFDCRYEDYNVPCFTVEKEFGNFFPLIMFGLPQVGPVKFRLGGGASLLYWAQVGGAASVSYILPTSGWPTFEFMLLGTVDAMYVLIMEGYFELSASLSAPLMVMPPPEKWGFFFGAGPEVRYVQGLDWKKFHKVRFGVTLMGGVKFF